MNTETVSQLPLKRNTFSVYKTADLENFEEPKIIFDGAKCGFWADRDFWASELHKYNGKYYLFGSCKADNKHRATHIFVCDTPDGEFVPLTEQPITPSDWECLDGTFWIEDGKTKMLWSSFYQGRYLVLDAWSDSLGGKWNHGGSRFDFDGGHAMLIEKLDGTKMISLHSPNKANMERAVFYKW